MGRTKNKLTQKTLPQEFDVDIKPEDPLFVISIVSKMIGMPVWTLRKLDEMGVIKPKRIGKKTRCYSKTQIQKLTYVHYLMENKHVNISAVKYVLEMEFNE